MTELGEGLPDYPEMDRRQTTPSLVMYRLGMVEVLATRNTEDIAKLTQFMSRYESRSKTMHGFLALLIGLIPSIPAYILLLSQH